MDGGRRARPGGRHCGQRLGKRSGDPDDLVDAAEAGHKPGTPGAPAKPHRYAGDERLARVLADLRSGIRPSAAGLASEWGTGRRTAERIIRTARTRLTS